MTMSRDIKHTKSVTQVPQHTENIIPNENNINLGKLRTFAHSLNVEKEGAKESGPIRRDSAGTLA